jgi:hypothetical protein
VSVPLLAIAENNQGGRGENTTSQQHEQEESQARRTSLTSPGHTTTPAEWPAR